MDQSQGSQTWYSQGHVLSELGRYEGALDRYDRVLEIKPDSYQAWCDRGYALEHLERYEEAIASFEKAICNFLSAQIYASLAWPRHCLGPTEPL
jgi:tetratricopeptide (TPR) repeat protein